MTTASKGELVSHVADPNGNLFAGPGEMRARCAAFDWRSTELGAPASWSNSLRSIVSTMLSSRHPMFLWWGSDLTQIFNDGYLPSFGTTGRDRKALGAKGAEHWIEIWPTIGPQIEGVMSRGEATWHEDQLVPIERNGRVENVWWTYGYSPVRDDDGSIGGVLVVVQETTARVLAIQERDRLLEAERLARAEADRANRAKGDFLAVMSHELRTPLNAIGGYAELLEIGVHGPITPDQAKALSRIQQSQRHLLGLINGVLNYSRVNAKAVDFQIEEVRVDEVLSVCEALVAPQARAKDLSMRYEVDNPNLTAITDREKLQQIVLNLLSNAVKFTESGGAITLRCAAESEQVLAIRVIDSGCGIPGDDLERVFEPFVQLDAKLTRTNEGTGLGLSISRDLARGIGGNLVVERSSSEGTIFALLLPRISKIE